MTHQEVLKEIASRIWEEGVTLNSKVSSLVVSSDFNPEDVERDKALGGKVAYQLTWLEKGKSVLVRIFNMDSYGAGRTLKTTDYQIEI